MKSEWFLNEFLKARGIEEHSRLSKDIMQLLGYLYDFNVSESVGDFSHTMRIIDGIEDNTIRNVFMKYLEEKMNG